MEKVHAVSSPSRGSLRWAILRKAIKVAPPPSNTADHSIERCAKEISRKALGGFKLISCHVITEDLEEELHLLDRKFQAGPNEIFVCFKLPVEGDSKLIMTQRLEDHIDLGDFKISNSHDVDTTGLLCCWPSEDVLAYYCLNHCEIFRSKRVLELGSGYGLAGLAIAACTDASEVVISDGNPQVINYVQDNINMNARTFGSTIVKSMVLHWNQEHSSDMLSSFDIILASDCTFFKEFHDCLAHTIQSLLKKSETSEAIFLSPKRGDSLDKFLVKIKNNGLHYELAEKYDSEVWNLHHKFQNRSDISWPNYDAEHCYPLLIRITLRKPITIYPAK